MLRASVASGDAVKEIAPRRLGHPKSVSNTHMARALPDRTSPSIRSPCTSVVQRTISSCGNSKRASTHIRKATLQEGPFQLHLRYPARFWALGWGRSCASGNIAERLKPAWHRSRRIDFISRDIPVSYSCPRSGAGDSGRCWGDQQLIKLGRGDALLNPSSVARLPWAFIPPG